MNKCTRLKTNLKAIQFEKGWSDLSSLSWVNNLYLEIWHALNRLSGKERNYIDIVLSRYGLLDDLPLSFVDIGGNQEISLSKETVRRYLKEAVKQIRAQEKEGFLVPRPYERVRALFKETAQSNQSFIKLNDWMKLKLFADFKNNKDGLLNFLEDAGLTHYTIGKDIYCFSKNENLIHIKQMIRRSRREESASRSMARILKYKKIITFLPPELANEYKDLALSKNVSVQRLYENALGLFIQKAPWKKFSGFFSDVKMVTYHGKYGSWKEVLLYIDKSLLDKSFFVAKSLEITPRAFICRALSWYSLLGHLDVNSEIKDNLS